ncbi:MAG: permease, partial [Candidatus Cloacimonetes bacterium]|nr:permease [Candidatus Cloacimonadota bacterium]
MEWKNEWKKLLLMIAVFLGSFFLPANSPRLQNAIMESLHMLKEYAQRHVIFCLLPAFFIAGAISVFISQASVIKYLGARAKKVTAYAV